jgi:rhamnogalacturonan endolyase
MDSTGDYGQTRWGLRADENLFDYHWVRDSIQGPMPKMSALTNPIQDWTFQLQDSSFYTKYDYADYIEGRHVHGMAGARSGLGLFVIQASHDYLNGGPTKQYQNVHSDPFLICMFNCGHFQSDKRVGDNKISKDWIKLNGPFLLYANQGSDVNAVWKDAKKRTEIEMAQWPYQWMKNDFYPLIRSSVSGTLLMNNIPVLNNTQIVLADTGHDWQAQSNGYMYAARTEAGGKFLLNSVRPGFYKLYAYGNNSLEEFKGPDLIIRENEDLNLGSVKWKSDTSWKKIWQLGQADRTTKGFKWADHKRTYDLFKKTPENLSFLIGKSKEAEDWFYAQTKNGIWEILFDLNEGALHLDSLKLTIAFAGASRNPQLQILLNGQWVGSISDLGNDASIYRSAIAGGYYQTRQLVLKANTLIKGQNSLQLKLVNPKPGAGVMYDALLMSSR